jgi:glycosyltransferase involved in cell wall biosynthesis
VKSINPSSVAVIIPAYNESNSIGRVVSAIIAIGFYAIVVDDGSIDGTEKIAKNHGAKVLRRDKNFGYDAALSYGVAYCIEKEFKYLITFDADGQHAPDDLFKFLVFFNAGYEVVVGYRESFQRWGEVIFSWLSILLWGIKDPLCGMKGYSTKFLSEKPSYDTYGSIGTEQLIRAIREHKKIAQIAILIRNRESKSRFGSGLFANLKIIRALFLAIFCK